MIYYASTRFPNIKRIFLILFLILLNDFPDLIISGSENGNFSFKSNGTYSIIDNLQSTENGIFKIDLNKDLQVLKNNAFEIWLSGTRFTLKINFVFEVSDELKVNGIDFHFVDNSTKKEVTFYSHFLFEIDVGASLICNASATKENYTFNLVNNMGYSLEIDFKEVQLQTSTNISQSLDCKYLLNQKINSQNHTYSLKVIGILLILLVYTTVILLLTILWKMKKKEVPFYWSEFITGKYNHKQYLITDENLTQVAIVNEK